MQKSTVSILLIFMILLFQAQAGPLSCASCFGYTGTSVGTLFAAAAQCFSLAFPPWICTCFAANGLIVSVGALIICLPICIAPTP